jgi:hypothetical protein
MSYSYQGVRTMPGTTYRNDMPEPGYVYKGANIESPQVIAARNRQRVTVRRITDGRCTCCGYKPGSIGYQAVHGE